MKSGNNTDQWIILPILFMTNNYVGKYHIEIEHWYFDWDKANKFWRFLL